jgi:hypothetical protein
VRKLTLILVVIISAFRNEAQQGNCILKPPYYTIHFGSGNVEDLNSMVSSRYSRVPSYCPSDGHYAYTPHTSDCFRGDWFTLTADHTPGDRDGNMLLVNSSPRSGIFLNTTIPGLKPKTTYEFGVWMMNVCKITEKCPFPLLPDITIHLQTVQGKNVAQLSTGEVERVHSPEWKQYQFMFTTPAVATDLTLIMVNNAPGGCGNDFVMDDITFRECVPPPPAVVRKKPNNVPARKPSTTAAPEKKTNKPTTAKVVPKAVTKPAVKSPAKATSKPSSKPLAKAPGKTIQPASQQPQVARQKIDSQKVAPVVRQRSLVLPPAPAVLRNRANALVKTIEMQKGEIRVDLYDNGEIDDDTVSIYHNNRLLAARSRLSQKAITFRIVVDDAHPHHELVMVAENLGSIPPNTSLMVVTAGEIRHEVFISSTKQKNAKVVFELANK